MDHRISLFPQPGDEPSSRMCGTDGTIPVLSLAGEHGHVELAFHNLDAAVRYLDALADEATPLATKVRVHQQWGRDHGVTCGCGYVVEGLTRVEAERFASQHDDSNYGDCDPRVFTAVDTPEAALLAAVEGTPSDPQAADRIRAKYADEVTS